MNSVLIILVDVIELGSRKKSQWKELIGWFNWEDCIRDIRIQYIQNHLSEQ